MDTFWQQIEDKKHLRKQARKGVVVMRKVWEIGKKNVWKGLSEKIVVV